MSIENSREKKHPKRRGLIAKSVAIALGTTSPLVATAEAQNNGGRTNVCENHEQSPLSTEMESLVMGGFGRIDGEFDDNIYTIDTLTDRQLERLMQRFNSCTTVSNTARERYQPFVDRLRLERTARQALRNALASGADISIANERYRQTYLASGIDIVRIQQTQQEVARIFNQDSFNDITSAISSANREFSQRVAFTRIASAIY